MTKLKTSALIGRGDTPNAYDHNTNKGINRSLAAAGQINGVMSGATQDLKVIPIDWDVLGLDESIHGVEVAKLSHDIVAKSQTDFDPNSYGSLANYEANTVNTNKILDNLAASDMGGAEQKIMSIVDLTKDFSREVSAKPGLIARLVTTGKTKIRNVRAKYDTVSERIDSIMGDLQKVQDQLGASSNAIRELDSINKKEYHATALYIAAGRMALNQLINELNAVDENGNNELSHDFHMVRKLHGLEKRLHDLELTQIHRNQQAPQYAIILENNEAVIDKLTSVKSTLIPAWRSGITTTLAIQNVQKSTSLIDTIQNATDSYMLENSRQLKQSTRQVVEMSQRGVFNLDVLKEVQINLEDSMSDVIRIQHEGAVKRTAEIKEVRKLQLKIDNLAINEVSNTINRVTESAQPVIDIEQRVEQA